MEVMHKGITIIDCEDMLSLDCELVDGLIKQGYIDPSEVIEINFTDDPEEEGRFKILFRNESQLNRNGFYVYEAGTLYNYND